MESSIGGMADREWNPLSSAIYSTSIDQEADFMAQLNNCSLPNTTSSNLGFSWCSHNESDANMVLFEECSMHSMYSFSQGSSYTYNSGVSPIYYNPNNSCHISANNNTVEAKNKNYFVEEEEEDFLNQDLSNVAPEDTADNLSEMNSKKRSLIPLHKNKRMVKAKKNDHEKPNYSTDINIAEGRHPVLHRQSSGSCLSEDDSNASNLKGASAAPNSNGKSRTSRSTATDPHSLYARKRREKINEKLRILQNLLPNATKVDISTMLEEAVQYVKFLQNQIKLLSSDDLWIYAPIAYNGTDIGVGLNIDTTLKS